ncbi:hypothetical protein TKK_0011061 [Trichogramma kaykai]|uniref:PRANC domain-containing protein n=1 Tax=Trichogramma kaykai TaxID=54128 RepID=A0ABD2WUD0_9HYME
MFMQMEFFNLDENEVITVQADQHDSESESWTKYYKDDGDALLVKAATYDTYEDFENAYCIEHGCMPLHHAIKSNKPAIVRKILLKGTDVNKVDSLSSTPLYYSILMDNAEIVELLLKSGATAQDSFTENAIQFTYFQRVCQSSHWKIVKLFLDHGCNVNDIFTSDYWNCPKYSRPLHLAITHRRLETIQLLINCNVDLNDANEDGESPLYLACAEDYVEAVELLLSKNALVNTQAHDRTTPLHQAIKCGNHRIVELLLSHGAFIEYGDIDSVENICVPIHEAIKNGHFKIIEELLSHGLHVDMNINKPVSSDYSGFLHTAVETEQIEIVNLLLKFNADVYIRDNNNRVPLHLAAYNENEVIMELLLDYDVNLKVSWEFSTLNAIDKDHCTPFHIACKGRNIDSVQYLIQSHADINAESFKGETPLYFACETGDLAIVKLLIKSGACVNAYTEDNVTPLHVAVKGTHEKIVELLLMHEAVTINQDKNGKIPLEYAVDNLDMRNIELLLQYNPDVNNEHYRKVFLAVLNIHKTFGSEIVDYFFKYGFEIKLEDKSTNVIFTAVTNGYYNIVEQLLNEGADANVSVEGSTLLHSATKNHHCDIIKLLIKHNANVHAKDHVDKLAVHYAIENDDKEILEFFLNNGINTKDYPDLLHYSILKCSNKCKDNLDILLRYDADINYCDEQGINALHLIIQFLRSDVREDYNSLTKFNKYLMSDYIAETVDFLLEKGVNVNAKTAFGWTALHMAIVLDENLDKLVETLLKYDADVDCKNDVGHTPLHLCCQKGNFRIISLLLNFGADINIEDPDGRTPLDAVFKIKQEYQKKAKEISTAVFVNCVEDLISSYFITRAYIDCCNRAVAIFHNHIIKMKIAKLYLNPKNAVYLDDSHRNFQATCLKEINDLKELKINNYVPVYNVLVGDLTEILRFTKNENIQNICEILENPVKFPLYGSMIIERLKKATRREGFLVRAKEALNSLSNFGLPDACTENIIVYLKNEDLRNLASICSQNDEMDVTD